MSMQKSAKLLNLNVFVKFEVELEWSLKGFHYQFFMVVMFRIFLFLRLKETNYYLREKSKPEDMFSTEVAFDCFSMS